MNSRVEFIIDQELDFQNHLIGAKIYSTYNNSANDTNYYFDKIKNADGEGKRKIFENKSRKFYSDNSLVIRKLLLKQVQEMWNLIEDDYFERMEKIHQNKFPFKKIYGVLSTTPAIYGYSFDIERPWFACRYDYPLKAISTAMHEIMHVFFIEYFWSKCKNKFDLDNKQTYNLKEALTIILNLEFDDMRFFLDVDKPGQNKLRQKIKEDWLKYKDINIVLEEASLFIKSQE